MPQQEMTDKNRNKAASPCGVGVAVTEAVAEAEEAGWFSSWKLPSLPDLLSFPAATLGWPSLAEHLPGGGQNGCPIVKARDGCLRGRTQRSEAGTVYYAFKGVPYAKPPLGDLRFRAPQPPEPWTDVRDAGHEGNVCAQPVVKSIKIHPRSWALKDMSAFMAIMPTLIRRAGKMLRQSEDCLYLNVFTPELPRAEHAEPAPLRPVMFWIHGGGFLVGDGDGDVFGPEYFLDMGIVVVTINYRLGAFGFLSVGTEAAPGNAGLKDQSMALRWVRDNIAVFGGDPNRVTIFGESAGAVSAHMHTLSPLSRGLFHGVIACSGSALNEWALTSRQLVKARELAKVLGIEVTDPADLVDALRRQSADRITHGTLKMCSLERFVANELAFMPVVEPAGKDAFLCEDPALILREGRQADVPVILGVNDREGLLWFIGNAPAGRHNPHSASEMAALERRCAEELFLSDEVHAALTPEQRVECHNEIMQYYFGNKGLSKETLPQFVDLFGDLCFVNSLIVATKAHAAANKNAPVYAYYMCFEGRLGFFKRLMKLYKYPGVSHGDELGYLFRIGILPEIQLGPESKDLLIRKRMLKLWYNFITTGNPTPDENDADLGVTWTPSARSSGCMDYLEFGDTLRMRQDPPSERVLFWDGLYRKYMGRSIMS